MFELIYTKVLVLHIIAVMVAVGTVTVTDYLHILGLRDPRLEKRTLFVFPYLSKLIWIALVIIYVAGALMVIAKPETLQNTLFWLKMLLVFVVTINGLVLHYKIFPEIEHGVKNNRYPVRLLRQAAFCGSLSVVTWYSIVVLAMTKDIGYSRGQFIAVYLIALFIAFSIALHFEKKNRK